MNQKKLVWTIAGVLSIVLVTGGVWYYQVKKATAATDNYVTGEVRFGNISKRIDATGTIQPPSQYNLSFSGKGRITKINAEVGDKVKAGQVLAEIDSAAANQQVLQAKAAVAQAKLRLEQLKAGPTQSELLSAQSSLARAEGALYNAKANLEAIKADPASTEVAVQQAANSVKTAQADYDLAKAQLDAKKAGASSSDIQYAELQVEQAEAALASAEAAMSDTVITAPVDGTITELNGKVGENPSGTGGFMVLVGSSSDMEIVVPVDEADLGSVKEGQGVDVTLSAYPDKKFSGKVSLVSPTGRNQNNVTLFDVTVIASNVDDMMKPGMSANVSIVLEQKQNVLTVPSEAVHSNGEQRTVLIPPADNKSIPETRIVRIGLDDGVNAEVLEGLQEGDVVITGNRIQRTQSSQGSNPFSSGRGGMSMGLSRR